MCLQYMEPEIQISSDTALVADPLARSFEHQILKLKSNDFLDILLDTTVLENSERYNSKILSDIQKKNIIQADHMTTCGIVEPIFDCRAKRNFSEMSSPTLMRQSSI